MRIATYNVEWFTHLFDDAGTLLSDQKWSGRENVTRAAQSAALGQVFRALDADAVMVIEAPDTNRRRSSVRALETFARTYQLRARAAAIGYPNTTEQEIVLLYDPDTLAVRHDPQENSNAPRFDGRFRIDLDIDATPDTVEFSKPPLELAVETKEGGFRMIGVHAKSKAPHGADGPEDAMRRAIAARRKQLAQCIWIRRRVDAHLAAGDPLVVLGDFNDGPGLDEYEKLFGRSGVEIVLGQGRVSAERLYDPHARRALTGRLAASPSTARFYLEEEGQYLHALLDYIMVTADLRRLQPTWRIWHPFDDPDCYRDEGLREALLIASDHFPVSMDIAL